MKLLPSLQRCPPIGGPRRSRASKKPSYPGFCGVVSGHRYYNPSTGRWLSRDPLGETQSRNLYGFVSNDPADRIDLLGLAQCGRCGPDVTVAVQTTLNEIETRFNGWSIGQKINACRSLYVPLSTASGAWMMFEVANLGFGGWSFPTPPAVQGDAASGCDRTVKYGGRCFNAGDVHYLMWGKVNNLCYQRLHGMAIVISGWADPLWSLDMALGAVDYWKISHGDPDRFRQGASLFTTIGYGGSYGSMPPVGPPIEQTQCDPKQSSPCGLKSLTWRWYPYQLLPWEMGDK